jgi:hypothetical protein
VTDQFDADASLLRSAGARRNHDPLGAQSFDFIHAHLIIAADLDFRAQFSEVLDQVVSERIVIVEDKDHRIILSAIEALGGRSRINCGAWWHA